MSNNDNSAIFNYHRSMIAWHGNKSHGALGWTDLDSQLLRFSILSEMSHFGGCSILDAGCGHGDLLAYLVPLYEGITYTGVEQIPELLEEAQCRYGKLSYVHFLQADFIHDELPLSDFVLVSGSLNYFQSDPGFIYHAISKLYQSSKSGLGFNLLRQIIPNGLLASYEPQQILNFCGTICPNVQLRTDYSPEDFTVYMYR
jgi:SAM-dependent methyltransferase